MSIKKDTRSPVLSIVGCTNRVWFGFLRKYGFDSPFIYRIILGTCITLLLTPLRIYERLCLGDAIDNTKIHDSPVFILGHWRSGTTLLHNILSKDSQFGYVTYEHGLFPHSFLKNSIISFITRNAMPRTRPMDNMEIDVHSPQEEEQALVALSGHSVYNMWIDPNQQLEFWRGYGLLDNCSMKEQWDRGYIKLLKTATYHFGGKRLLLKNPSNTARIPYLLEKFPNAKFIYIYRNPYKVYESTKNLHRKAGPYFHLKAVDTAAIDNNILQIYREMIESYRTGRELLNADRLIEVKYEDFILDQESGIRSIYDQLDLGNYDEIAPELRNYLNSIESYVPNNFQPDQRSVETVNKQMTVAFELHDYEKLNDKKGIANDQV